MFITFFDSETTSAGYRVDLAWHEVVELLSEFRRGPCTVADCLGKPRNKHKGCPHKSGKSWSPAEFQEDRRSKANVERVNLLVLDLDDITPEDQQKLPDVHTRAILHSSHSSGHSAAPPGSVCLRLVLALSRPVSRQEYETLRRGAELLLGGPLPGLDKRVKSSAHLYFLPSAPVDADTMFTTFDGPPLDVDEALQKVAPPKLDRAPSRPDAVSDEDLAAGNPDAEEALEQPGLPPIEMRVQMAKEFLSHQQPAETNHHGGSRTLGICAAIVRGFLVTDMQHALEAFWDWNLTCKPPWDPAIDDNGPDSIYRKFRQAAQADRNEEGDVTWGQYVREHKQRQLLFSIAARSSLPSGAPKPAKPTTSDDEADQEAEQVRPSIVVYPGEGHQAIAEAVTALGKLDALYVRGTELVTLDLPPPPTTIEQTLRDEEGQGDTFLDLVARREPDSPSYTPLSNGAVFETLSRVAEWYKPDEKNGQIKKCDPPAVIVGAIHTRKSWKPIRTIRGIINSPQFRHDGSLITSPGWDPITGLYMTRTGVCPDLDMTPSKDRARRCIEELYEAVCDFPFETSIDRTAWLAALLGVLVIPAAGCPPLVTITSPTPGTGKSLLAHAIGVIVAGRRMACTPFTEHDEEMRKRYMSHATAGDQLILIDNVPNGCRFNWPSLDGALTASEVNDRMLGTNTIMRARTFWAWFVTGNNVAAYKDTARRTLEVRIAFEGEKPQSRKAESFKHHPYLPWLFQQRPRLLRAALELMLAFMNAGLPASGLTPLGSFEGWSRIVRDCLVWAGEDDCQKKVVSELQDQDPVRAAQLGFLLQLESIGAKTEADRLWSKTILDLASTRAAGKTVSIAAFKPNPFREALLELEVAQDGDLPTASKLSSRLRKLVGDRHLEPKSGRLLWLESKIKDNYAAWWVATKPMNGVNS